MVVEATLGHTRRKHHQTYQTKIFLSITAMTQKRIFKPIGIPIQNLFLPTKLQVTHQKSTKKHHHLPGPKPETQTSKNNAGKGSTTTATMRFTTPNLKQFQALKPEKSHTVILAVCQPKGWVYIEMNLEFQTFASGYSEYAY